MARPGPVPTERVAVLSDEVVEPGGAWVLYVMSHQRRTGWNWALQRAVSLARELGKPLVVAETLTCGGRWDTARGHQFVLDGMRDNGRRLDAAGVGYLPLVEREAGTAKAAVGHLARLACAVVVDEAPTLERPAWLGEGVGRRVEAVDGHGLLPLVAAPEAFLTAYAFRRFLQRELPRRLEEVPEAEPLARAGLAPAKVSLADLPGDWEAAPDLAALRLDQGVGPVETRGGQDAGLARLDAFVAEGLAGYGELRNHPDDDATSGLAPYLARGHVAAHQVFAEVAEHQGWDEGLLADTARGNRAGWWGMSESAEGFLDQLVTWRELGYNQAAKREDWREWSSLPDWAQRTLQKHAGDAREYVYDEGELEEARTHDALWNAAQWQLVREGRLHNYLRMLWGKKILEWSPDPREALRAMEQLNNRWALDGQDPNSYTGILWVLGRHDRAWGPERPVFGTVRYMSSANTARKVRVKGYLVRHRAGDGTSEARAG